jgi:fucose permease
VSKRPSIRFRGSLLWICYIGFVSLGLPDTLIGVAWPSIRTTFGLHQNDIAWIFIGGGCSYFISSFFAGRLLRKFNVGVLLGASSALVALSGFDYAAARIWPLFAFGSLLHGLGSGAIDAGLNHYVASHFSARHMNWLHACYSLGAMLGPFLMTVMITHGDSWRMGYLIVALTLLVLSILFISTRARWDDHRTPSNISPDMPPATPVSAAHALRNRVVRLQIVLFFIYTGLEVALGQWSFTVLTESRNIPRDLAGTWVTIYWASILAGRIIFGFVVDRVGIDL